MADIDPWGDVELGNYSEKMDKFGIEPIEEIEERLPDHRFIRRGIIFGHRDLDELLDARDEGDDFAMITGIMPSGVFHFGHKCVVDQIKMYQEMGAEITIAAADIEAYNTRNMSLEEARELVVEEYLKNYVALGIDLENIDFYFQSQAGNDHLAKAAMFGRYLTQNEMEATYGNADPAKMSSAQVQYADILRPQFSENGGSKPTVVPVGIDQDPHIRLTREVARKYRDQEFVKPASTYNKFMRGLQGGKMSSSKPKSYIALTDSVEEAKEKIDQAKTGGKDSLEEHREKGADVEEDMVFELLAFHLIKDDEELERIRREYSSGEMLSGELKQIAKEKIEEFLTEHQRKREEASEEVEQYIEENFDFN
ncbi:MAG: tryptophan--tRNA ligase [Nanohaloarchaea archaeon]|nr:tryptophan--tRNA ligase [Candidatus Nanohaloarchaea archaeon]